MHWLRTKMRFSETEVLIRLDRISAVVASLTADDDPNEYCNIVLDNGDDLTVYGSIKGILGLIEEAQ